MLEQSREPFGPPGGLAWPARVHRDGDRAELTLDGGGHACGTRPHEGVEPVDRLVEPVQQLRRPHDVVAVGLERYHLSHVVDASGGV